MTIKWVFFDLDDTLFDFTKGSLYSLRRLWDEEAILRARFSDEQRFLDEYHTHNSALWARHERGEISSEFLKAERFRLSLFPDQTDQKTWEISRRLNDSYLSTLGACRFLCEGARELLEELSGFCLIGILTNGFTEVQYKKLRSTGIDRYIQRMVISDEIGVQKPDVRLFRYAERETGATPGTTVMIGDNPQNDVKGALDADWRAVYYDRKGKPFEHEGRTYLGRITSLEEILPLLPLNW